MALRASASESARRIAQDDAFAVVDRAHLCVLMPRLVPLTTTDAAFVVVTVLIFRLDEELSLIHI